VNPLSSTWEMPLPDGVCPDQVRLSFRGGEVRVSVDGRLQWKFTVPARARCRSWISVGSLYFSYSLGGSRP
jgi:hypothetical protein